jgi:hypothetical protein
VVFSKVRTATLAARSSASSRNVSGRLQALPDAYFAERRDMKKQTPKKAVRGAAAKGPGPGRPKGVPNKTTQMLKDAILLAAEKSGHDGKGKGGLIGYLKRVASEDVKAFAGLLGRVLPLQVTGEGGGPLQFAKIERVIVRPGA